jgi:hypothetical protein
MGLRGLKSSVMKKNRDPAASLEHEVIYAVVTLYAGLCAIILAIHFLQPERTETPPAAPPVQPQGARA